MERTLDQLVHQHFRPSLSSLYARIVREGTGCVMDGVKVFNEKAPFLSGKIINLASYLLTDLNGAEPSPTDFITETRYIVALMSQLPTETWGTLNGVAGLYRLQQAGLLERAVDGESLARFKLSWDWRSFVDPATHDLINKPTNYYGVAYGIAKYRELLGWEDSAISERLFARLLEHIHRYSGECDYMDETPGEGRFDRYSINIPAELCHLLAESATPIPARLLTMLRNSAEIHLQLANSAGNGFSYGRSIGIFGGAASLEVLSVAAAMGVLTEAETELAYDLILKIVAQWLDFWWDPQMNAFNLWEKGRRTDGYRNKFRILDVLLTIYLLLFDKYRFWRNAGFSSRLPASDFQERLAALPHSRYFQFSKTETAERGLIIIRDRRHVFSLPIINGGIKYFKTSPYLPIPHQNWVIESVPESVHPQLIPKLILNDGAEIMPIAFIKNITLHDAGDECRVDFEYDSFCLVNGSIPAPFPGLSGKTSLSFRNGSIRGTYLMQPQSAPLPIREIVIEFPSFSTGPRLMGDKVVYHEGIIHEAQVEGLERCDIENVENEELYHTSHGPLKTRARWWSGPQTARGPFAIRWVIKYR